MIMNNPDLSYKNGDSATVSVGDWLLLDAVMLLNLIPIVGTVASIAIYIVVAANRETAPSVQTRIITSLIWLGVWVFVLLFLDVLVITGALQVGWVPEALNGFIRFGE